ncbi:hypothetical protein [Uliginosibacterium gangwonense]|uniref:hypothetical protein n=1 Tax=Uliginosibacterium gangwonense TaxID=392736 RepID=UPI000379EB6D|nr:hypothetical protein [Uliginosibacterium gangwonense]
MTEPTSPSRHLAALTAAFLQSARPLQILGWLMCAAAVAGALFAALHGLRCAGILFALALMSGLPLAWYVLRIRFDVAAFELIAQYTDAADTLADFDAALCQLGLRQKADPRDLVQRACASRTLVYRLATVVCGQLIFVLIGMGTLYA